MSESNRNQGEPKVESSQPRVQTTGEKVREQVVTLVVAIAIAMGIRTFIIEPFRIPSGSMLPTLLIGDHLFVNKFIYGPRIPFTNVRLPGWREPNRGDVVVFSVGRSPRQPDLIIPLDRKPSLPADDFVKRIVGLPGDRVRVSAGRVYINDELVERVAMNEEFVGDSQRRLDVYSERLNGCEHIVLDDPAMRGLQRDEFTIEPGRYFMMGDNRDHSNDSRAWGTVRFDEFKGPAFILYWSWDVNGNVLSFLNPVNWWSADKRWSRMFQRVQCGPEEPAP